MTKLRVAVGKIESWIDIFPALVSTEYKCPSGVRIRYSRPGEDGPHGVAFHGKVCLLWVSESGSYSGFNWYFSILTV